ncbi:MAG: ATP-binding cassette domain-containing protein [Candidatus Wallbacteria bacterium]|nr:ATP-binding cassette domain-containing protein [Candidatus Wallbacteria bacterium]
MRGLTLSVEAGTVFGLFGPNGADKTTFLRILTTLARPTAGEDASRNTTRWRESPDSVRDTGFFASPGASIFRPEVTLDTVF